MKKIIPFQKEIPFNDTISEIVSISLENDIQKSNHRFKGDFIISGEYKLSMSSTHIDTFHFNVPFEIELTDRYDDTDATIDIDDFYYEIINNQELSIHIDVLIDKLEEKKEEEKSEKIVLEIEEDLDREDVNRKEVQESVNTSEEKISEVDFSKIIEDVRIEKKQEEKIEEVKEEIVYEEKENIERNEERKEMKDQITSMFDDFIDDNEYKTYKIYIVKEQDSIEEILKKYDMTLEILKKYNDMNEIKKGDKIIIPYVKSKQN